MLCLICSGITTKIFSSLLLHKYQVAYFYCSSCEFLSTEKPYWLAEAYSHAIAKTDIGLLARNNNLAQSSAVLLYFLFGPNKTYLDYAGGYGIFTRLMRDIGFDFYWDDLYVSNLFADGFDLKAAIGKDFSVVTTFECVEHLADPVVELEKMFALAPALLFSTDFLPNPIPQPNDWWYYALSSGQHISFYRLKTLHVLAKKFGKHCNSFGNLHLFSDKKISNYWFEKLIIYRKFLFNYSVKKNMQSLAKHDSALMQNKVVTEQLLSQKRSIYE